jgi:antitoxin (DNA-binding transcriptional repressor) of toxin-antitoxin stability system
MTTIELSELGPVAERLKRGETLEVREEGRLVATVVPATSDDLEARMRELEAKGLVRRLGNGDPIPPEFYTDELPQCEGGSIVEELIRDRDED